MRFDAADFRVDPDIARAETLPVEAFRDPAYLALELETLFTRAWLLAPNEPPAVRGSRLPFELMGRPLFWQRGWDDEELRCFPNVCTHAWYPLVHGASRGPSIVCGQHGRKFDCRGRFVGQGGFSGLADFPRACDHLTPFPCGQWRGLPFVALGQPAASLGSELAEVAASVAQLPLESARRSRAVAEVREVAGNWKQHAWNYADRFHIGFIHRSPGGLTHAIDMASYQTELYPRASLQWAYARNPDDGFDPAVLAPRFRDGERRVFALWWFVFPNLALNFYPWGLSINVYEPIRPDVTLFRWIHLVTDDAKYARRDSSWLSAQVDAEDVDALAHVQKSMRGGHLPRGRFAPRDETGPHWFHHLAYRETFPGATVPAKET